LGSKLAFDSSGRRGAARRSCALCLLALAALHASAHDPRPQPLTFDRISDGWPVPDFALVDQHGDAFTRHRMLGQWTFVLFGDTRCASPCLSGLSTLSALRERIGRAQAVHSTQVLFVSLDPRDDAARLKAYLAPYDSELVAATGAPQVLDAFADELGMKQRFERAAGYDGSLVLVGPEGNVRAIYLPPYDVRLLTADYMLKRARRR
jgi:protein SCO1/2